MKDMFVSVARYALVYRKTLAVLFVGLCLESLYDVGVRYSLKFIIDKAIVEGDMQALVFILSLLAAGAIVFNIVVIGCDYVWAKTGGRILNDIRLDMFRHMQNLPVGYYRNSSVGDLSARFNADMSQIENGIVLALPMALMGLIEVAVTLALMLSLNPLMCAIAATGIVISLLVPRTVQSRAMDASFQLRREEGRMSGYVQENLTGQGIIKTYGLEHRASRDFSLRLDELLKRLARANFLSYLVSRLPSLTFLLLQLVVLGVGGWLAVNGQITIGDLVAYQALLIGLNYAIYNLTWMIPSFIDASAGWRRIKEILDEPLTIQDAPHAQPLDHFAQAVEFDNVSFSYPTSRASSLKRVNLRIKAGEYVVFVGRSGAGKSSIINLLMRFYEVSDGAIRIDGTDIRDLTLSSLRGKFGLVSQEVMLFSTSVRDNIRMGSLDATDEEIEAAARSAEIHDFIMSLPEGYDTPAGTAGARFSGGERQRIALARALVRKPAVLILDEFSSALDPGTEAAILKTIERLKGTCTILSVTHRLSMAETADRSVVMRDGRIVESGSHDELLALHGEYARLWRRAVRDDRPTPQAPSTVPADA